MKRKRGSKLRYIVEHAYFSTYSLLCALRLQLKNQYDLLQMYTMPESLMISCILPKMMGAKIMMDLADPSIEVFRTKYTSKSSTLFLPLLSLVEKMAVLLSDEIITPNLGFKRVMVERGCPAEKIHIVMNGPDPYLFQEQSSDKNRSQETFTLLFHGTNFARHGLLVAIRAMPAVLKEIPNAKLLVVGSGEKEYIERCKSLVQEVGIEKNVEFRGRIPITEIPATIRSVSLGLIVNERSPFTDTNFPQRIFEYAALRVPLVVCRLEGIEDYLSDKDVYYFQAGNADDLAAQIIHLHHDEKTRTAMLDHCFETCKKLEWKTPYLQLVEKMLQEK